MHYWILVDVFLRLVCYHSYTIPRIISSLYISRSVLESVLQQPFWKIDTYFLVSYSPQLYKAS